MPATTTTIKSTNNGVNLFANGNADHYDIHREVVSVAMAYLDRYVAAHVVNRRIFQLAAMTALYLAIKLYEPGKLCLSSLLDLSRGRTYRHNGKLDATESPMVRPTANSIGVLS